jgi:rhodanese-related sulfurtransferase
VLLCASGTRASRAAGLLQKAGYAKVVAVSGGLTAWREAGLPVDKSAA